MAATEERVLSIVQKVNVAGEGNAVAMVAGDLVVADTYVVEAGADFFRHEVAAIRMEGAPSAVYAIAERVLRVGLVILGGPYEDKTTVARQAARALVEQGPATVRGCPVMEWNRGRDFEGLLLALRGEKRASVVLLTGIVPRHVGFDPARLREAAAAAGHVVVATTDAPRAAWRMTGGDEHFWLELSAERLFDPGALVTDLVMRLGAVRAELAEGVFAEARQTDLSTVCGITLADLAARLKTPANAAVFVQQLAAAGERGALTPEAVADLADAATSEGRRVERWFHAALAPHEQLLALGLAFFDGLADDQLFGALERWVEQVRARRDPSQRAYDYGDLDNLESFFAMVGGDAGGTRIESRWPHLRRALFRAAWSSHRRQVLAALPLLTGLVAQSVRKDEKDLELFGTADRRFQVRRSVGDALSDVGLLSVAAVEPALVALACEGDAEAQTVAARAIARWREHGAHRQLFDLFDRWYDDERIRDMASDNLVGRERRRGIGAHLRATVAIAVGHAAQHDPPGQLSPQLLARIRQLGADRSSLVRSRFRAALPLLVSSHLTELRPLLREMAAYPELVQPLGQALARAYVTAPREVEATLAAWHAECDATRPAAFDPRIVSPRDALLMVLAFAYGEMTYEGPGALAAETGFERLRGIMQHERHPKVRSAVVLAIGRLARTRFERVERLLQRVAQHVTPDELDEIVPLLLTVFRDQRAAQEGGDEVVEIDGQRYEVWLRSGRPLTAVETAMIRWAREPEHLVAQAIGLQASVAFAMAVDRHETPRVAEKRAERAQQALALENALVPTAPVRLVRAPAGWYTASFVPWLATLRAPARRAAVAGLLPEALAQGRRNPAGLSYVLNRWQRLNGDRGVGDLARLLRSAMSWHGSAWMLLAGPGFLLFLLIALLLT